MDQARGLLAIFLYSKDARVCIIIYYYYYFLRISVQAEKILNTSQLINGLSSFLVSNHSQEFL